MKENLVVWADIPVKNMERAMEFYSKVLGVKLQVVECGDKKVAFFPFSPGVASGTLVEGGKPSLDGALVYLSGGADLAKPLGRVEAAGGKVLMPKTKMGENAFIAHFKDTEGNRVALHSAK